MKILVTGGAGFIGSAVVRFLIGHTEDSVVNVDKLTYAGNLESLAGVAGNDRYRFEQVDICDHAALEAVFQKHQPDAVMHLAAESHVDRSIEGPAAFVETNIVGTYTLLEVCRCYWGSLPDERRESFRLHHVSTDELYGDLKGPEGPVTRATPYAPRSPYSDSIARAYHLLRHRHRTCRCAGVLTT